MWTPQAVQTFFTAQHCKYDSLLSSTDSRYFPVTVESEPDPTLIQNLITSFLNSAKTDDDNHQGGLNKVYQNSGLVGLTPKPHGTHWRQTFAGSDMDGLVKLRDKPDPNDHIMFGLWRNV